MSRDNAYLADMLDSARIIQQHVADMTRDGFLNDLRTQDAVIRRFSIIGEAARHLSENALKALPNIHWKLIIGMRNILIHDYDDVDPKRVWEDTQKDIPVLVGQIESYLKTQPPESNQKLKPNQQSMSTAES